MRHSLCHSPCHPPRRFAPMALLGVLLVACSAEKTASPTMTPRVVVHAILDPSMGEQVILVERTHTDSTAKRASVTSRDPIVARGGVPISGARVVIIGPAEKDSLVAVEDRILRTDGTGNGVYRIKSVVRAAPNDDAPDEMLRLVPGATYRLRVETDLSTVRGTTRMPSFAPVADRIARRFNLDRDTLLLPRRSADVGAAAYVVRHVLPGFSSSNRVTAGIRDRLLLPAALQDSSWGFGAERGDIWPGTTQTFSVAAVDANYLKYSVVGADPFGDDVQGNSLQGGVGVFGAVATLTDVALDLTADRDHGIEGEWSPLGASAGLPVALSLYESPRFPRASGGVLALTGTARLSSGVVLIAQAALAGESLTLSLAPAANASNTRRFTGSFDGETLTLQAAGSQIKLRYRLVP